MFNLSAALATEDPSPDLLLETPHGRTEPLINPAMWTHITVQGLYQVTLCFVLCLLPLFPVCHADAALAEHGMHCMLQFCDADAELAKHGIHCMLTVC